MNLTTENTAVVLDSTSDYADAPSRFPNMRFVPLYVRFGDETYRDYVELAPEAFFEKLRSSPVLPATSQPTPQDFVTTYESLAGYDTYAVRGLPPGPIATPTVGSIDAALKPDTKSKYTYFVAIPDGDGKHDFSKSLAEHEQKLREYGY